MSKIKDLSNQRFGYLVAKSIDKNPNNKRIKWICQCDCGNICVVSSNDLRTGHTSSCGCKKFEPSHIKHGKRNTRIYHTWRSMKDRCYNIYCKEYLHYGGRGITVCPEWKDDFQAFYNWALSNGYSDDLTIDRIDVNGNYEPSNCRWATVKEQSINKRGTVKITIKNTCKPLKQWCNEFDFPYALAYGRYRKITNSGMDCKDLSIIFCKDTLYIKNREKPSRTKPYVDYRERPIIQYDLSKNPIKEWSGIKEIKQFTDFNKNAVLNCCYGLALTHKGFMWRYKNDTYPEFQSKK